MEHIEYAHLALADLTPFPGNAKKHDLDELRLSLRKGQFQPVVARWEEDKQRYTILSGNGTVEAAALEGWEKIDTKVISCTDEEALWINLAANKVGADEGYEDELLAGLLEQLNGDFTGTGWNADDLDDLLAALEKVEETPYVATGASYNETPEETAAREEMGSGMSLAARGIRETVVILPQDEHDELHSLLAKTRSLIKETDVTNGQIVLRGVRALHEKLQGA